MNIPLVQQIVLNKSIRIMNNNEMKKAIIDFLSNDFQWHRFDATASIGILNDDDWQDIATACGKNLYIDGGMVYTEDAFARFKTYSPNQR